MVRSIYEEMKQAGLTPTEMIGELVCALSVFVIPLAMYIASEGIVR